MDFRACIPSRQVEWPVRTYSKETGFVLRPTDVAFDRVPIICYGSAGTPYLRWIQCGMPKLGQYASILKTVFFLYENREDAERGERSGGTGFLVAVPSPKWGLPLHYIHGVTNH